MDKLYWFDASLTALGALLGILMFLHPEPFRRWFQARQPWGWARRGYDWRYANVFMRLFGLASGVATFSTLQAIITDAPPKVGPFEPARNFAGDISDTAAVEHWVLSDVAPH